MLKINGLGGISATIVADSVSSVTGKRITTFELNYPRFIHAEFLTHRQFSRNAASSRAIPVSKLRQLVEERPASPIHWGRNQPGMQAKQELSGDDLESTKETWGYAAKTAALYAGVFDSVGAHKQIANRILEPFQFIKVVCTATEFENFFWLRCHEDAQPEIRELADCMYQAREQSVPTILSPGDWHVPYYEGNFGQGIWKPSGYVINRGDGKFIQTDWKRGGCTLEEALKISASCCAQVSYRATDNSIDKAEKIYKALVESVPVHASPFEHQGTPMQCFDSLSYAAHGWGFEDGITQISVNSDINSCNLWSGNFCGFIQHRQLLDNHTKR